MFENVIYNRRISLGEGVVLVNGVARWSGEEIFSLGDGVENNAGVAEWTGEPIYALGTGVVNNSGTANFSGLQIYTLGTNVTNVAGTATYTGPKDLWQTVTFSEATATIENTRINSLSQDGDGWTTVSIKNDGTTADDYPSRMPGYIFNLKDAYGNIVSGPFTGQWVLELLIEIDNTSLPTTTAKANCYIGLFNASGDPTSGSCDNGGAIGWRLDGATTRILVSKRTVESTANTSSNEFKVNGFLTLGKGVTHIVANSMDGSGNLSTGKLQDFNNSYGTNSSFKLWVGIGCATTSNTPTGPHTLKCRFKYNLIPLTAIP